MLQNDLPQAPSEDIPRDPYMAHREATKPGQRNGSVDVQDRRWRFQQFNRKVLRFFCQWDDRENLHGENRTFTLHYFMEDQTMEIFETRGANSGRDGFSRLLKRQRLPKQVRIYWRCLFDKNLFLFAVSSSFRHGEQKHLH